MKKNLLKIILLLVICFTFISVPFPAAADVDNFVYLGGIPAGFSLNTRGATVVGLSEVITDGVAVSPSKEAGVKNGDIILGVSGTDVNTSAEIEKAIEGKTEVELKILRGDEIIYIKVKPQPDNLCKNKLGLFIRNNVSGIGTITFVKDGRFASLGHPVLTDSGNLIEILNGKLYNCTVTGAIKGEKGKAGELRGIFLKDEPFAFAEVNKQSGIYGTISDENLKKLNLKKVETGEAKIGNAKIYTTVDGSTPKEYDISIVKVDKNEASNKNLVIKITDEDLIKITGGIVQGMSGSPILQGGKIVGAVTHVFINDPLRGFGIIIENMS